MHTIEISFLKFVLDCTGNKWFGGGTRRTWHEVYQDYKNCLHKYQIIHFFTWEHSDFDDIHQNDAMYMCMCMCTIVYIMHNHAQIINLRMTWLKKCIT